jgi:hypothetical protein
VSVEQWYSGKCEYCGQHLRAKMYNKFRKSIDQELEQRSGFRCYVADGDFFEERKRNGIFQAVAYIETIRVYEGTPEDFERLYHIEQKYLLVSKSRDFKEWTHYYIGDKNLNPWPGKKTLGRQIHEKMGIPSYVVWHRNECTKFLVVGIMDLIGGKQPKIMTVEEYKQFIIGL